MIEYKACVMGLIFLVLFTYTIKAQGFQSLGFGFNNHVYGLTYDSNSNYLYASGNFTTSGPGGGNTVLNHIAKWDGLNWSTVGIGANKAVYTTILFNGDLIAAGYFDTIGGIPSQGLARWDGTNWYDLVNTVTTINPYYLSLFVNGSDLFVGGNFDTINGMPADRIARFDGSTWHTYPSLNSSFGSGTVISAITVYNNELYIGGNFNSGIGKSDIMKWNGTSWVSVGGGLSGGNTHVNKFVQYQNKLYVMGYFYTNYGDPGNCIASWDGTNWDSLGNGVISSNVIEGYVFNNKIYFGGIIYSADTFPVSNLAIWDGANWSSITSANFSNGITSITSFGNELYFGGGFVTVNNDSMFFITKYIDNTLLTEESFIPEVLIYPNPSLDFITFELKNNSKPFSLILRDLTGQQILNQMITNTQKVEIKQLPESIYFYELTNGINKRYYGKIMKL